MLGLADYGSSGEEDEEVNTTSAIKIKTLPTPSPQATMTTKPAPSKLKAKTQGNKSGKKKQRITVSLLPPDIQAALARGGNLDSEDDEDEETPVSGSWK